MAVVKLTKRYADSARYKGPGADYRWDRDLVGFGLRVYPTGRKSWVVAIPTTKGRTIRRIAPLSLMDYRTARKDAAQARLAALQGEESVKAGIAGRATVRDLYARYVKDHASLHFKPSTRQIVGWVWKKHIEPALGDLKVSDVRRDHVADLYASLKNKPAIANQTLSWLRHMFNLAETWEPAWREPGTNPCRRIERYPAGRRKRALTLAEIAALGSATRQAMQTGEERLTCCVAIFAYLYTGARRGEILTLQWADLHLDAELPLIALRDSKTGPRDILLPPDDEGIEHPLIPLLRKLPRIKGNDHVFAGVRRGSHLHDQTMRKVFYRLLKKAGIDRGKGLNRVTIHTLRHTWITHGFEAGEPIEIVGRAAGHGDRHTTETYAHLSTGRKAEVSRRIARRIKGAIDRA